MRMGLAIGTGLTMFLSNCGTFTFEPMGNLSKKSITTRIDLRIGMRVGTVLDHLTFFHLSFKVLVRPYVLDHLTFFHLAFKV
jgi:hypothetical protein